MILLLIYEIVSGFAQANAKVCSLTTEYSKSFSDSWGVVSANGLGGTRKVPSQIAPAGTEIAAVYAGCYGVTLVTAFFA